MNRDRQILGQIAHDAASQQFLLIRSQHCLIVDRQLFVPTLAYPRSVGVQPTIDEPEHKYGNRFRNGPDELDPYLDMVCWVLQTRKAADWSLQPAAPGHGRRPDLADIQLHEVYEIKPDNNAGIRSGRIAIRDFMSLLRQADDEYTAYARQSDRYRGDLYATFDCQTWKGGSWTPRPVSANIGGDRVVFKFRNCSETPGVLLWSV